MSKHLFKRIVWLTVGVIVLAGCVCGGLWLLNNRNVSIAETDEPTDEQMEQYFKEYAEVTSKYDPENLLIVVNERRPETYGAVEVVEAPNHTYYLMYDSAEARDEAYAKLEQDDLMSVEKNAKMQLASFNSWGVTAMGLDHASESIGYGGNTVKVAIVDSGLDLDLFRRYFPSVELWTYDIETNSEQTEMYDTNGHGTHIAGTIAEAAPHNTKILVIRATRGEENELYTSDVTTGIEKARSQSANVINLSLGAPGQDMSQRLAIERASSYNTITVTAAGNEKGAVLYPAAYDSTIAVSALNSDLSFAEDYSNFGSTIDFAAPGTNIRSINGRSSGTSMATPHVVAAVAALKSYNWSISLADTVGLLSQHVQDLGEPGKDQYFGYGMIDFSGAEFCEDGGYCDQYGVFATSAPTYARMEIDEVTLTPLNYYSITNLMLTEVKLYTDETNYVTKRLQDVHDVTITGYGPETHGLQTVEIACEGFSTTVYVVNPENYTPGWEYQVNESNQALLTRYYDVRDYDYENEVSLTRLYVPKQIDGRDVVELSVSNRTIEYDDYSYEVKDTVFERSSYAGRAIQEIYLPDTLTVVREDTFENFWELRKVVMAADAVEVGERAFSNASRLRVLEGRIGKMGEYAFSNDTHLEMVTLAEGMTEIPQSAFYGCHTLKEIEIPSTVTIIHSSAFGNARSLERVAFSGNNLHEIGSSAFSWTTKLTGITFPEGLETIEHNAFYGSGLTTAHIPASVTEIGTGAFAYNNNFATITVDPDNPKYYHVEDREGKGRALMYDWYDEKILLVGTNTFAIPDGTTWIGYNAFAGITEAGSLFIPDSVKSIEGNAFYGCVGLVDVTVPKLDYIGSQAFEKDYEAGYYTGSTPLNAKLWVYTDNVAYDYVVENGFNYETINATYARVVDPFNYGDSLTDETEIEYYYEYGVRENGVFTNYTGIDGELVTETVEDLVDYSYSGEAEFFRIGDTYFEATYEDLLGNNATMRVVVTVNGEYPEYTVPTGLTGKLRGSLMDIELPEGFSWMEGDTYLYDLGEFTYMVRYTPGDLNTYAPVENIPVTVTVVPGREKLPDPVVTVDNKTYDGSWEIDPSLIHVTIEGLDASDYSVYGSTGSNEVGTTTAYINISLYADVAEEYGFGDNYDIWYTYSIDDYEILPAESVELEVDDKTRGVAEYEVVSDGIVVTAEQACTVIVTYDGGTTYARVPTVAVEGEENTYKFEFEITADVEVLLVLRGDGNMDGRLSIADSNMINKSKVSPTLERIYRPLSELEALILDLNNSGTISIADSTLINRSLVSPSLEGVYQAIAW